MYGGTSADSWKSVNYAHPNWLFRIACLNQLAIIRWYSVARQVVALSWWSESKCQSTSLLVWGCNTDSQGSVHIGNLLLLLLMSKLLLLLVMVTEALDGKVAIVIVGAPFNRFNIEALPCSLRLQHSFSKALTNCYSFGQVAQQSGLPAACSRWPSKAASTSANKNGEQQRRAC